MVQQRFVLNAPGSKREVPKREDKESIENKTDDKLSTYSIKDDSETEFETHDSETVIDIENNDNYDDMFMYEFIKAKRGITVEESKVLSYIIKHVSEDGFYKEKLNDIDVNVKINYSFVNELTKKTFVFENEKEKEKFFLYWFDYIKLRENQIEIQFSRYVIKYLSALKEWLNHYNCNEVFFFNSAYTPRFYEVMCEHGLVENGKIVIQEKEMRRLLFCESKYKQIAGFKTRTIDIAIGELKQIKKLNIHCNYVLSPTNKVKAFSFSLRK